MQKIVEESKNDSAREISFEELMDYKNDLVKAVEKEKMKDVMDILSMMTKRKFTKQLLRPELKLQGVLKSIQRKSYESEFKNVPFLASQLIEKLLKIKNAKDKKPEGDSKNKPALSYLK